MFGIKPKPTAKPNAAVLRQRFIERIDSALADSDFAELHDRDVADILQSLASECAADAAGYHEIDSLMMIDSDRNRVIAELRLAAIQLRDAVLALNAAIDRCKPTAPRN